MDRPVGLRERKKADTRDALRRAALELSAVHGPDAVGVEAICERAGVSKRTFFNYFATKDEAVLGWSEVDLAGLARAVRERPAGEDPLTSLETAMALLAGAATGSDVWQAQLALLREHPDLRGRLVATGRRLEATLAEALAVRSGTTPADPEPVLLAAVAVTALRVTLDRWLDSPGGTDGVALLAEAFAVLRRPAHRSSIASS